ncbi:2-polyprenyl-6-methoxyphenol hydroxylase-like FAD-dependent oxidoreductase [Stackebrandtia albiflava]|uniref:2-polyprenyl-6-methoxyphenol hydroxylase-like FAD-dependent oxidoreductase n=1 Tax=Stackebrandtia albiflava TaxID=406432 RepID=A0A562VE89_9ACTN|nr:NAD(P)/FAD-dependent oxidoreductase [Stackebrandtia albiflava]TWJ16206.1 2-polyprenyl-6-methoxyphenol hydroxylase-like FAD-dependent oxidoreductase [Stackebrandtia albiflava]
MAKQRRAVIVGAGIAGLSSAIALAQAGWRVAVLERGDRLRDDGTALLVQPNAIRALRALGLGVAIDAIASPFDAGRFRRSDGRPLIRLAGEDGASRPGGNTVVLHRGDLFEALMSALGDRVEVHTGVTATHIDLVQTAAGDNSRRWPADLVVGADGVGSAVRAGIDPLAKVATVGTVAFRAVIPPHRVPDGLDGGGESHGADGRRFLYAPLRARGAYWAAVVRGGLRPEPVEVRHRLVAEWFEGWHDPVPQLIAATRAEEISQQQISFLRPLPRRYTHLTESGGAVLVGDAAHAMTPDLGQGAGLALEDGVTLGVCLTRESIPDGLREYERLRRARTARLARASRRLAALLTTRGRFSTTMRDGLLRAVPDSWLNRGTTAASDWSPPTPD